MADYYGRQGGYFRWALEETYGTAYGSPAWSDYMEVPEDGDGLVRVIERIPRRSIKARSYASMVDINEAAEGDIGFDCDYDQLGRFLYGVMGTKDRAGTDTEPWDNYFYPADGLPSFRSAVGRGGAQFTYSGMKVNTMTFNQSAGQYLQFTAGILARAEASYTTVSSPSTATFLPIKSAHMTTGTIGGFTLVDSSGGTYLLETLELTINNNLRADRWLPGSVFRGEPKRNDALMVSGTIVMDWDDNVLNPSGTGLLQDWRDNDSLVGNFKWNNGDQTPSTDERELQIYLPAMKIDGEPLIATSRGILQATINFSCIDATIGSATAALNGLNSGTNPAASQAPIMIRLSNGDDADDDYEGT